MNFNLHFIHRLFEDLKDKNKRICTVKQNNILFTLLTTSFGLYTIIRPSIYKFKTGYMQCTLNSMSYGIP